MAITLESCPLFIGGEWLQPKVAGTPIFNPSTGDIIAECPLGTPADVNAAVEAAQAALPAWMETPPVERVRILARFKMLMEDNFEDIVRCNTREHGKTLAEARGDVHRGIEFGKGSGHGLGRGAAFARRTLLAFDGFVGSAKREGREA